MPLIVANAAVQSVAPWKVSSARPAVPTLSLPPPPGSQMDPTAGSTVPPPAVAPSNTPMRHATSPASRSGCPSPQLWTTPSSWSSPSTAGTSLKPHKMSFRASPLTSSPMAQLSLPSPTLTETGATAQPAPPPLPAFDEPVTSIPRVRHCAVSPPQPFLAPPTVPGSPGLSTTQSALFSSPALLPVTTPITVYRTYTSPPLGPEMHAAPPSAACYHPGMYGAYGVQRSPLTHALAAGRHSPTGPFFGFDGHAYAFPRGWSDAAMRVEAEVMAGYSLIPLGHAGHTISPDAPMMMSPYVDDATSSEWPSPLLLNNTTNAVDGYYYYDNSSNDSDSLRSDALMQLASVQHRLRVLHEYCRATMGMPAPQVPTTAAESVSDASAAAQWLPSQSSCLPTDRAGAEAAALPRSAPTTTTMAMMPPVPSFQSVAAPPLLPSLTHTEVNMTMQTFPGARWRHDPYCARVLMSEEEAVQATASASASAPAMVASSAAAHGQLEAEEDHDTTVAPRAPKRARGSTTADASGYSSDESCDDASVVATAATTRRMGSVRLSAGVPVAGTAADAPDTVDAEHHHPSRRPEPSGHRLITSKRVAAPQPQHEQDKSSLPQHREDSASPSSRSIARRTIATDASSANTTTTTVAAATSDSFRTPVRRRAVNATAADTPASVMTAGTDCSSGSGSSVSSRDSTGRTDGLPSPIAIAGKEEEESVSERSPPDCRRCRRQPHRRHRAAVHRSSTPEGVSAQMEPTEPTEAHRSRDSGSSISPRNVDLPARAETDDDTAPQQSRHRTPPPPVIRGVGPQEPEQDSDGDKAVATAATRPSSVAMRATTTTTTTAPATPPNPHRSIDIPPPKSVQVQRWFERQQQQQQQHQDAARPVGSEARTPLPLPSVDGNAPADSLRRGPLPPYTSPLPVPDTADGNGATPNLDVRDAWAMEAAEGTELITASALKEQITSAWFSVLPYLFCDAEDQRLARDDRGHRARGGYTRRPPRWGPQLVPCAMTATAADKKDKAGSDETTTTAAGDGQGESGQIQCVVHLQHRYRVSVCAAVRMYACGDLVVADGDMGLDVGMVTEVWTSKEMDAMSAEERQAVGLPARMRTLSHARVYRHTTEIEADWYMNTLPVLEGNTLCFLQQLHIRHNLFQTCRVEHMNFLACELQADMRKVYVYFESERDIRFLELATFLNSIFRCRIWVHKVCRHEPLWANNFVWPATRDEDDSDTADARAENDAA